MTAARETPRLSRSLPDTPAAPPVRMVHLGVGNFHRAHQAWYTAHSPDADQWGIAAFTGRRSDTADALRPQDGLYTLITRSAEGDTFELIGALSAVHAAAEHETYLDYLGRPELAVITITVTEAGYLRGADGHLDAGRDVVASDVQALRSDPRGPVASLPAKLVAGLLARRAAATAGLPSVPVSRRGGLSLGVALGNRPQTYAFREWDCPSLVDSLPLPSWGAGDGGRDVGRSVGSGVAKVNRDSSAAVAPKSATSYSACRARTELGPPRA